MKSNTHEIAPATLVGMVLGLIGVLSLFSATASAQTYLYSQADLPTGSGPTAVIAADFNGDGRPDLAVVNSGGTVSILLGQADGTFGTKTDFPTGTSPTTLVVADFNADGKLDLATLIALCINNATT